MDNKCYAKFMADMVPLVEALLKCEDDARAQHTPSGQRLHPVVEALQDFEAEHPCELKNRQKCKKLVPFECKFCNLVFPEWEDLKRHVVEKHPRHKLPKIGG